MSYTYLTQSMANLFQLLGVPYLVGKRKFKLVFQGPGRLSELQCRRFSGSFHDFFFREKGLDRTILLSWLENPAILSWSFTEKKDISNISTQHHAGLVGFDSTARNKAIGFGW